MVNVVNAPSMFNPKDEYEVKRKRKMAEALMKQAEMPDSNEMVSSIVVQHSPFEYLAKALTQGVAGSQERNADEQEAQIERERSGRMAEAIRTGNMDGFANGSPEEQQIALKRQFEVQDQKNKEALMMAILGKKAELGVGGGNSPAPIQIVEEVQRRLQAGDVEGANMLMQVAKVYDKGVQPFSPQGGLPPAFNGPPQEGSNNPPQLSPSAMPGYGGAVGQIAGQKKYQEAFGGETGKAAGEAAASLNTLDAQMPRLEDVASELSALGKDATYTKAGQLANTLKREAGLPVGKGAVARTEYISKVDNEVLPLLRQTFGAQFTQKEGESLKATLGDPNKSPEEKDAVLRSFISTKKAQMGTLQRQIGQSNIPQVPNQSPVVGEVKSRYGLE